jgi:paraquat-inducible protein A
MVVNREINGQARVGLTAKKAGLASCHVCHLVVGQQGSHADGPCPRCHAPIHSRKVDSLSRTWALVLTAVILYVPANIYPVMTVSKLGQGEPSTILSGVMHLIHAGMWPLALIVLVASVIVPVGKLIILAYLLLSVQYRSLRRPKDRTSLYRILELFGHWSMVDVFLVSILVALVDMGFLATIEPGIGVFYFGAVVITTLFASRAFDPRLIWDVIDDDLG